MIAAAFQWLAAAHAQKPVVSCPFQSEPSCCSRMTTTQRNATQRNATQRNTTQRNASIISLCCNKQQRRSHGKTARETCIQCHTNLQPINQHTSEPSLPIVNSTIAVGSEAERSTSVWLFAIVLRSMRHAKCSKLSFQLDFLRSSSTIYQPTRANTSIDTIATRW
jgi:hypothetical protein